jgi:hypothetical protein
VIGLPLAHMGHAIAILPFFAPPLVLTLGLVVITVRDRLRHRAPEPASVHSIPEETR